MVAERGFARWGRFTVRRRRLVLGSSILFVVLAAVLGSGAFGVLRGGGFADPASESARAANLMSEVFGETDAGAVLILDAGRDIDDPAVEAEAANLMSRIGAEPDVVSMSSYWDLGRDPSLRSDDGTAALALVRLDPALDDDARSERLSELVDRWSGPVGSLEVSWAGSGPVFAAIGAQVQSDLATAQLIAVPITLVLLLVVFGGLIAAALPLLIGMISITGALLVLFLLGSITDVSVYSVNLVTALGLGLGIDFSLFMVSRFREEIHRGLDIEAAVVRTVETAGRTIAFSGGTTMLSLAALYVFPLYFLRSFAYAGVATIALATAAALVTLPALLAAVGHRIDALALWRRGHAPTDVDAGRLARVARAVMARPLTVAVLVSAVLLAAGAPFLRAEFSTPDYRVLPEGNPARDANDLLRAEFAALEAGAFPVVALGLSADDRALTQLAATLSTLPEVRRVDTAAGRFVTGQQVAPAPADAARYAADGSSWLNLVPAVEPVSRAAQDLVEQIRSLELDGAELVVGGSAAELVDTKAAIGERLPLVVLIIGLTTLVLLFFLLGSLVLPIKAVVLNLLSLSATYGAMVWVFQDGNLAGALGFTPTGGIDTTMPILMFCVAFGLSIDYEVFLMSRIREERSTGATTEVATARGLQRTGGIVTASALLLAVTFGAFAAGGTTFIKLFGVGLAVAVLADAFIVRMTLVPAIMKLGGEHTWWKPGGATVPPLVADEPSTPDRVPVG